MIVITSFKRPSLPLSHIVNAYVVRPITWDFAEILASVHASPCLNKSSISNVVSSNRNIAVWQISVFTWRAARWCSFLFLQTIYEVCLFVWIYCMDKSSGHNSGPMPQVYKIKRLVVKAVMIPIHRIILVHAKLQSCVFPVLLLTWHQN